MTLSVEWDSYLMRLDAAGTRATIWTQNNYGDMTDTNDGSSAGGFAGDVKCRLIALDVALMEGPRLARGGQEYAAADSA